jgi:NAD(P)-dependent dehydrogenase (short-subunit alcohol dehydrogenase family)
MDARSDAPLRRGGSFRRGGPVRARPEEIARAVVFLASEEGGFITGSTLPINDGQYMMEGAAL